MGGKRYQKCVFTGRAPLAGAACPTDQKQMSKKLATRFCDSASERSVTFKRRGVALPGNEDAWVSVGALDAAGRPRKNLIDGSMDGRANDGRKIVGGTFGAEYGQMLAGA